MLTRSVLVGAEASYRSINHAMLAQALGTSRSDRDPVYQSVARMIEEERGVILNPYGDFRDLARELSDDNLLFAALFAAWSIDHFQEQETYRINYHFPMSGNDLRVVINRVLEQCAFDYRLDIRRLVLAAGEPPKQAHKLKDLRAEDQLGVDFLRAAEHGHPVGLIFLDIDEFKSLNSKYTESVIDAVVLLPFAELLLHAVRDRGFAYSVGGDEFIVLLHNITPDEALVFATRLCRHVRAWAFHHEGNRITLTISAGVACRPAHGSALKDVRVAANEAENRAKKDGRDRACLATKS